MADKVLNFWFSEVKNWFSRGNDTLVKERFTGLLQDCMDNKLEYWKDTIDGHIAYIILLDQFSRHIYRDTNPYINDAKAYKATKQLLVKIDINELTDEYLVFVLMPLRHCRNEEDQNIILDLIKDRNSELINRFRYHTLKKLNDTLEQFYNVLEIPFEFSHLYYSLDTPLVGTISTFVETRKKKDKNSIIVSLSGGVDSMVILFILIQLRDILQIDVFVVHLDYANREESKYEALFLMKFCEQLRIPFIHRLVHEAQRHNTDRKRYEELTRTIRFNEYKKLINKLDSNVIGVILGHHRGDVEENIVFNLMKGRSLTDLTVLRESSVQDGVTLLRPLLRHHKDEIYAYASKCRLPYFKDTTPIWSNRGKYRNVLLPALQDSFGYGVISNINKIGQESDDLKIMLKEMINDYLKKMIDNTLPLVNKPLTFWRCFFTEFCLRNKISVIHYKSITTFYENIKKGGRMTLSNKLSVMVDKRSITFIVR
jgi:tRNA(Ile)-lysidine synthetase-like protein